MVVNNIIILLGAINALQLPRRHCYGSTRYRLTYYYSILLSLSFHTSVLGKSHTTSVDVHNEYCSYKTRIIGVVTQSYNIVIAITVRRSSSRYCEFHVVFVDP